MSILKAVGIFLILAAILLHIGHGCISTTKCEAEQVPVQEAA